MAVLLGGVAVRMIRYGCIVGRCGCEDDKVWLYCWEVWL